MKQPEKVYHFIFVSILFKVLIFVDICRNHRIFRPTTLQYDSVGINLFFSSCDLA